MYGVDGWVLYYNMDIWCVIGVIDKVLLGLWFMGGVWLCCYLWECYFYIGDMEFFCLVYFIMKEVGKFFDEIMVKELLYNWLVVCLSNFLENIYVGSNGKVIMVVGCILDNQLIFDLWNQIIMIVCLLGMDVEFVICLEQCLKEMVFMQIGCWG